MPFQSEKQRRYLWANEPEIARDWTDTYGSRIQKNNGGLTSIRQPYFSGGEIIEMGLKQIAMSQAKKKAQEYGYLPEPTQKRSTGSFLARMLANIFLGPVGGLMFDAGSAIYNRKGSSFGNPKSSFASNVSIPKIGNFNLRSGYGSQGAYEKARQDRINMKRQSNIIKTLQSGKYAPGWEKSAFDRVQKLGENLNLVDADDVSLTGRSKFKPKPTKTYVNPGRPHGNGGGNGNPGGGGQAAADAAGGASLSSPFNRGGLAALWQR